MGFKSIKRAYIESQQQELQVLRLMAFAIHILKESKDSQKSTN